MPQSSLRWRSLFESNLVGIAVRSEGGIVVDSNDAFARILGRTRAELIDARMAWMDLVPNGRGIPAPIDASSLAETAVAAPRATHLQRADGTTSRVLLGTCRVHESSDDVVFAIDLGGDGHLDESASQAEANFQTLIATTATGYVVVDGEGLVIDANPEYVRLTGRRTFAEIRGRRVLDWTAPYDIERNIRELAKCSTIGVVRSLEIDYVHPDGTIVPIEVNATAIGDGNARHWLGLCRDISERKRAQQALHDSEEILRQISDNIRDVFYLVNADATKTLYVNPAFEAIWGRTRDEFDRCDDVFRKGIHPDDREAAAARLRESLLERQPTTMQYRILKPDGEVRWVRDRAYPIVDEWGATRYLAGIVEDITERKQFEETQQRIVEDLEARFARRTEEIRRANERLQEESIVHQRLLAALKTSEEQYRLLADHSTDMISTHTLTGIYKYVSPASTVLLGWEPEELVGHDPYDFFHPEDLATIEGSHIRVLEKPDTQVVSYRFRRKSGEYSWFETTVRTVRSVPDGQPREIISVSRDISERKRLEALEDRRQWEIAHLSRLKTLGEMASGIAHELNQPLAAITNYAAVCRSRLQTDREATTLLEKIEAQAARAGEIIRRMRNLVRKREPHWSTVHLGEIVAESVAVLGHELRLSGVRARIQADDNVPMLLADRVQIEQVLINLLRNAIESMSGATGPPAGRKDLMIRVHAECEGTVTVAISDHGSGMSAEAAERIFEPFFSTKREGLGLGLSISRSIIESHGGRLWAETNSDRGATFSFSLPIKRKDGHEH